MFREFQTSYGIVRGHIEGDVVRLSRLRYALPPYGARRFAKPYPLDRWDGVLDATGPTAMAPQWPARLASVMGDYAIEQSEYCFTWTSGFRAKAIKNCRFSCSCMAEH